VALPYKVREPSDGYLRYLPVTEFRVCRRGLIERCRSWRLAPGGEDLVKLSPAPQDGERQDTRAQEQGGGGQQHGGTAQP
jgi:hypothetical protein